MNDTATATPSLERYRTAHRIQVVDGGDRRRCATDGIRVHPIRNGWRHDAAEIVDLMKAEYGGAWPSNRVGLEAMADAFLNEIGKGDVDDGDSE